MAQFRASTERFEMESATIISRKDLATNNEQHWRKINENFNSVDNLINQSAVSAGQVAIGIRNMFED